MMNDVDISFQIRLNIREFVPTGWEDLADKPRMLEQARVSLTDHDYTKSRENWR